jgi:Fe-S cluster assembly iron-binding protein IscA
MLKELEIIKTQIAVSVLALSRLLELLENEGRYQPYLEGAITTIESGCSDLEYAIEALKEQNANEPTD